MEFQQCTWGSKQLVFNPHEQFKWVQIFPAPDYRVTLSSYTQMSSIMIVLPFAPLIEENMNNMSALGREQLSSGDH